MHLYNTQDNGDRCFMAPKGDGFKEVRLPAKVVNGLLKMNELKRSDQFDVPFLKAVLIGFCTMKKIQEIGYINEEVFNVVKGKIYLFRVLLCCLIQLFLTRIIRMAY